MIMSPWSRATLFSALLLAPLAACTEPTSPSSDLSAAPDLSQPDLAPAALPITAPQKTWTWIDFPNSSCNDGTSTGVGVYLNSSKKVLIYQLGGGACWDYDTCYKLKTAALGPFGKAQFEQAKPAAPAGPFADWNMVFVPYCTGDLHGGDTERAYGMPAQRFYHKGMANMRAYLARLAVTFPDAEKLLVAGSSAGGYGTLLNYVSTRAAFPRAQGYLIDDCGPPLVQGDIPPALITLWDNAWDLKTALAPTCATCKDNLSALFPALSQRYPRDRFALLAFTQDQVIRSYVGNKSAADMEAATTRLLQQVISPLANTRSFAIASEKHVMLGDPQNHNAGGVNLLTWIGQMLNDDQTWKSVGP